MYFKWVILFAIPPPQCFMCVCGGGGGLDMTLDPESSCFLAVGLTIDLCNSLLGMG